METRNEWPPLSRTPPHAGITLGGVTEARACLPATTDDLEPKQQECV